MIEILPGIFYNPELDWFNQPQELIDLALEVEQTAPINFEMEVGIQNPKHQRFKFGVWEGTTEMGTFEMRVDIVYLYSIEHRAFLTKELNNIVTIKQL